MRGVWAGAGALSVEVEGPVAETAAIHCRAARYRCRSLSTGAATVNAGRSAFHAACNGCVHLTGMFVLVNRKAKHFMMCLDHETPQSCTEHAQTAVLPGERTVGDWV